MINRIDTALLTEVEARSKWCPEARVRSGDDAFAVNRFDNGAQHPFSLCVGAGCMLWRWHDDGPRPGRLIRSVPAQWDDGWDGTTGAAVVDVIRSAGWIGKPDDGQDWNLDEDEGRWYLCAPDLPPRGFCGKGGHPHQARLTAMQVDLLEHQLYNYRHTFRD